MPAASAAAAPPLDPPGVIALFQGFSVAPCRSLSVNQRHEKAGVLVRPMMIAPAFFRLAVTGRRESVCEGGVARPRPVERGRDGTARRDRAGADRLRQVGGIPCPELSL